MARGNIASLDRLMILAKNRSARLKQGLNDMLPFYRLPFEMTAEIIRNALPSESYPKHRYSVLLHLRGVSTRLTNVIDSSGSFWSHMSSQLHPELAEMALRNSGSYPLTLHLLNMHPRSSAQRFLGPLMSCSDRWWILIVDPHLHQQWSAMISARKPALRTLQVRSNLYQVGSPSNLSSFPELGHPPHLEYLSIVGRVQVDRDVLLDFVANLPELHTLELSGTRITMPPQPRHPIDVPRLRCLYVKNVDSDETAAQLLDLINASNAQLHIVTQRLLRSQPISSKLCESINARAYSLHTGPNPMVIHIRLFANDLSVLWDENKVALKIESPGGMGLSKSLFERLFVYTNRQINLWLNCPSLRHKSHLLPILHKSFPNLRALWILPSFEEADSIIDMLSRPIQREGINDEEEWLFPKLNRFQIRKTKDGQKFNRVLGLVDARAKSPKVATLTELSLKYGSITRWVLDLLGRKCHRVRTHEVSVIDVHHRSGVRTPIDVRFDPRRVLLLRVAGRPSPPARRKRRITYRFPRKALSHVSNVP